MIVAIAVIAVTQSLGIVLMAVVWVVVMRTVLNGQSELKMLTSQDKMMTTGMVEASMG